MRAIGGISLRQQGILNPPFPFPPSGASRGGRVPPTTLARCAPAKKRWHASMPRLPPQEGISKRSAEIPLAYPPNRLRRKESFMACGSKEEGFLMPAGAGDLGSRASSGMIEAMASGHQTENRLHRKLDTTRGSV
jgi:hypothetical protein